MKEIIISRETPRDLAIFDEIRISKGIEKYYAIAAGLLFLGIMTIGAIFFPPYELGLTIFQASVGGALIIIGSGMVLINNIRVKSRKKALQYGKLVEGIVVDHGRKFNPTSSTRYFTITIKYNDGKGDEHIDLNFPKKTIFDELPLQSTTLGILADLPKYKVFFPAEVDVKLVEKD